MITSRHLAIDLGAESGRLIVGVLEKDRLELHEISRFPTGMMFLSGEYHWNVYRVFEEIVDGLEKAASLHPDALASAGIDTWGVDYGLLDNSGRLIGLPYAYRDPRTNNIMEEFNAVLSLDRVYALTGIQMLQFNTLFQLFAETRNNPHVMDTVSDLLFIPDLFNYFLTGIKKTEFTNATTSQLINPRTGQWEQELFRKLGLDLGIMQEITPPCTILGELDAIGGERSRLKGMPVVSVASHDTASAIAAIPATEEHWAFMSTGTWALVGFEHDSPLITQETRNLNFTNEGGIQGFRVLKNMMGFWILQECRRKWGSENHSYRELAELAEKAKPFGFFIDPDAPQFLNPPDMPQAIEAYCHETGQKAPKDKASMIRGILESLALKSRKIILEINRIRQQPVEKIYITGGGVKNALFCQCVANATGLPVQTALAEGTAAGNIIAQAIATGYLKDLREGRRIIGSSLAPVHYYPADQPAWKAAFEEFLAHSAEW